MNFEKYGENECFEDFDTYEYLKSQFYFLSRDNKFYYTLSRTQAFMLLKANKFKLTDRKKKSIIYLINMIKKEGKFPSKPNHPIRINLRTRTIEHGVVRLFTLLFQRQYTVLWLEFVFD